MAARMLRSLTAAALVFAGLAAASPAGARPLPGVRVARPTRGFSLFAGTPAVDYRPNRVQCGIINRGTNCVDPTGSPVNESGFWPAGSPDNYVFNSGLQIAAIIPGTKTAAFPWPGDTVGTFFFDPRGDQTMGEGVTNIFNAGSSDDLANWPSAANATDTALYFSTLIGRQTVSQQDLWTRYWDGNTSLGNGRKHTMGILVDQRIMAWNYPAGNNDILYVIVRFINITSGQRADYDGLSQYGYTTGDIDDIFAVAQNYRATSQAFYNVTIPVGGFAWAQTYASYAADADEGDAGRNYSLGSTIFNTVINYKADFLEPTWQLPPSIFAAPFLSGPGMFGIKYLATPGNLGTAVMGNTTNGGAFPDAVGVPRLWRNLSGNLLPGDGVVCNFTGGGTPQSRHQCYWAQVPSDTRMFASSGPFTVNPGQAASTVVALVFAGSVATQAAATPGIVVNAALPAYDLGPYIGTTNGLPPGLPAIDGTRLFQNLDTVKIIDRVAGFANYTADVNGNGRVDQAEVITVPRSVLDKENVAQNIFNNKFLLPFAPDAPQFFLVPGDGQVTIVWQKSGSETTGNPFFAVASQPFQTCPGGVGQCLNALYDPNFRHYDVEGYRVWRGRTQSDMQVVAQFDYIGTTMADYTAEFFNETTYSNQCAPELGIQATCPVAYDTANTHTPTWTTTSPIAIPLSGSVRQIPPGGRVALADGTVFNVTVDTAVTGGASGFPGLTDNGVPFAFVDNTVVNGVRYFYSVTAFSINSLKSGPSSLSSPLVAKTTNPRAASGQEAFGTLGAVSLIGGDGTVLDAGASLPSINAATAVFSGPMPPTNGASLAFTAFVPQLIAASDSGTVLVTIDSIQPSYDCAPLGGNCIVGTYFISGQKVGSAAVTHVTVPYTVEGTTGPSLPAYAEFPATPVSATQAARFGGNSSYNMWMLMSLNWPGAWLLASPGRGWANSGSFLSASRPAYRGNGPRWWDGAANESLADPNGNVCDAVSSGGCVDTTGNGNVTLSTGANGGHVSGVLTGISFLWSPQGYQTVTNPMRDVDIMTSSVYRAADFKVFWNGTTAGKVDSVVDVTHHTRVPYSKSIRASWGILNDSSFTNTPAASTPDNNNAFLTWTDLLCVDPIATLGVLGGTACGTVTPATSAFLMDHALSNPMNWKPSAASRAGGSALVAQTTTGNGFIFYLNGRFFVMQMATTLAACCQGTVWNARFYSGVVRQTAAGAFSFTGFTRPPAVPGLRFKVSYTGSTFDPTTSNDSVMARIHTVPDPYYVTNSLEQTVNTKILRFVNLPSQAIIRIYSSSGVLIRIITHNDPGGGSEAVWDLRNRNNQFVASGVYFYHVEGPDGRTKIGRLTVVNYAQ